MSFRAKYEPLARQAAINAGINPDLFVRQINQESGFNPNAVSPAGAKGIAQFIPGTAKGMGVNTSDPVSSLQGAARLMANLTKKYGSEAYALAAYNGGEGAVNYFKKRGGIFHNPNAPANSWANQTGHYVAVITGGKADPTPKPNTLMAKLTPKTVDKPTVGMPAATTQAAVQPKAEDPTPQDFNDASDEDIISYLFGNTEDKADDPSSKEEGEEITIDLPKFDATKAFSKYSQGEDS
jgi:Transglycosylase SLT domain